MSGCQSGMIVEGVFHGDFRITEGGTLKCEDCGLIVGLRMTGQVEVRIPGDDSCKVMGFPVWGFQRLVRGQ